MSRYSQHPEVVVPSELCDTVERVRSGIEPVIILTGPDGEQLAALVSLSALALLNARNIALRSDVTEEESDCVGLRLRPS